MLHANTIPNVGVPGIQIAIIQIANSGSGNQRTIIAVARFALAAELLGIASRAAAAKSDASAAANAIATGDSGSSNPPANRRAATSADHHRQ